LRCADEGERRSLISHQETKRRISKRTVNEPVKDITDESVKLILRQFSCRYPMW